LRQTLGPRWWCAVQKMPWKMLWKIPWEIQWEKPGIDRDQGSKIKKERVLDIPQMDLARVGAHRQLRVPVVSWLGRACSEPGHRIFRPARIPRLGRMICRYPL